MEITNSFTLLSFLKEQNLLSPIVQSDCVESWWWPNALSFEVVIGAFLVQNTRWEQVEIALKNLKDRNLLNMESLSVQNDLSQYICGVGFFRQKNIRILQFCKNLLKDFGDYETFKLEVSKEWLLEQKGVGHETCDCILNYALGREVMVVDSYSVKLLRSFGYTFESYVELQEWFMQGIAENYVKVCALYGFEIPLNLLYARFHGKIVEYCKIKFKRNKNAK